MKFDIKPTNVLHEFRNAFKIIYMDENTKLYVFSKREVALIFLFMFLIAVTSFVFGVKVGKDYSFEKSGFIPQDKEKIDLLSGQEEKVNEVVEDYYFLKETLQKYLSNDTALNSYKTLVIVLHLKYLKQFYFEIV